MSPLGCGAAQGTIVRLKQLAGRGVEILQFEVARPLQRHPEAFGVPASPPQDVLGKSAGPGAHVAEVQKLVAIVVGQRLLRQTGGSDVNVTGRNAAAIPRARTHPVGRFWVGEHAVEAVVDVGHFHRCSKYGERDNVSVMSPARRANPARSHSAPVEEDSSSDGLVRVGTSARSPHLLAVQVVKHRL